VGLVAHTGEKKNAKYIQGFGGKNLTETTSRTIAETGVEYRAFHNVPRDYKTFITRKPKNLP